MSGRFFLAVLICAGLGHPASAREAAPSPPSGPDWDMIAFEVNSWGTPVSSWRLLSNGGGSWTETIKETNAKSGEYTLAWHEIEPNVQNYIAIERILRGLPQPAPDSQDCENFMTDMAYGTIRLTRGATTTEIAWNSGCMDDGYRPFLDVLKQADELMQKWGKASEVTRTETRP